VFKRIDNVKRNAFVSLERKCQKQEMMNNEEILKIFQGLLGFDGYSAKMKRPWNLSLRQSNVNEA